MNDFSEGAAYVDGQLVSIAEAKISLLDWGFLHSDATYDVAHVWKGKFFRLNDHIERFFSSMEKLHMSIPYTRDDLQAILVDCVRASGLRDAYVEMICTRGMPEPGSRDPRTCTNQFFAFAVPFIWIADPEKQKEGLDLVVSRRQRIPAASVDPTVKNYHWLDLVMGLFEAYERGGETAVVVDPHDLTGLSGRVHRHAGQEVARDEVEASALRVPGGVAAAVDRHGATRRAVREVAEEDVSPLRRARDVGHPAAVR